MTRFLWAVEQNCGDGKWQLLPNTVMTARCHAEFDMKCLKENYPNDKYRIVKYERIQP